MAILHIFSRFDCYLFHFDHFYKLIRRDEDCPVELVRGQHKFLVYGFVGAEVVLEEFIIDIPDNNYESFYNIGTNKIRHIGIKFSFDYSEDKSSVVITGLKLPPNSHDILLCFPWNLSKDCIYDNVWYVKSESEINNPSSYLLPIRAIRRNALKNHPEISAVILPSTFTEIGDEAFSECSGLKKIFFPKSIVRIGRFFHSAFVGCNSIERIVVSKNNPKYDSRDNCNAVIETASNQLVLGCKNTLIPNSVVSIGSFAFEGCRKMTNVTIPYGVECISHNAFSRCSSLKTVELPNTLKFISDKAFAYCRNLIEIELPQSLASIGSEAFQYCPNLHRILIRSKIPPIGARGIIPDKGDCLIYVPVQSVEAYKSAEYWSSYADRIQAIPE